MQVPTDVQIQERFEELPRVVQDAIQSADMAKALQEVGSAHGLHIDQLGALEDEALLVMLGFSNPATFAGRVAAALHTDERAAALVAAEVSERLFVPIRHAMREYMEERLRRSQQTANDKQQATSASAPLQASPPTAALASMQQPPVAAPAVIERMPGAVPPHFARQVPPEDMQPTITTAATGGKIIMPSGAAPLLHPFDAMLAQPTITTPTVSDLSVPGALATPQTPANKQYVRDPYREPVE